MQLPVQLLQHVACYLWLELTLKGLKWVDLVCVSVSESKRLMQQLLDSCSALTAMPEYIRRIPYVLTWKLMHNGQAASACILKSWLGQKVLRLV